MHLREIKVDRQGFQQGYPFTVPVVQHLSRLVLTSPVTIFVGENGTGKSTLLEAVAVAAGSILVGDGEETLGHVRKLADCLRLGWRVRTRKGFFLRAEDFLSFSRRLDAMRAEMQSGLGELEEEYRNRSAYALNLARMPVAGQLHELKKTYGGSLEAMSHGESFLHMFQQRLIPGGLYLLDEPETPLSPVKQLALIAMVGDMVRQDCQFIISTHSPILMAIPGAEILSFDELPPAVVQYDELEHVRLTRAFLNDPHSFLRHL